MKQILLLDKPWTVLHNYIDQYLDLYEALYSDTGLSSEGEILEYYRIEAKKRNAEILNLIEKKLSPDIIVGYHIEKGLHIPWRSKDIWLKWRDDGETRTIVNIRIQ